MASSNTTSEDDHRPLIDIVYAHNAAQDLRLLGGLMASDARIDNADLRLGAWIACLVIKLFRVSDGTSVLDLSRRAPDCMAEWRYVLMAAIQAHIGEQSIAVCGSIPQLWRTVLSADSVVATIVERYVSGAAASHHSDPEHLFGAPQTLSASVCLHTYSILKQIFREADGLQRQFDVPNASFECSSKRKFVKANFFARGWGTERATAVVDVRQTWMDSQLQLAIETAGNVAENMAGSRYDTPRFGEYAFLFATASKVIADDRLSDGARQIAIVLLEQWAVTTRDPINHCDDLWSEQAASIVSFPIDPVIDHPSIYRDWFSYDMDDEILTLHDALPWRRLLEGGLAPMATGKRVAIADMTRWLSGWHRKLKPAIVFLLDNLEDANLQVVIESVYNITHLVFARTGYGCARMVEGDTDELVGAYGFFLRTVLELWGEDHVRTGDTAIVVEPMMEIVFVFHQLQLAVPQPFSKVINGVTTQATSLEGSFSVEGGDVWDTLHRCYTTLVGVATLGEKLLAIENVAPAPGPPLRAGVARQLVRHTSTRQRNHALISRRKRMRNNVDVPDPDGAASTQTQLILDENEPRSVAPAQDEDGFCSACLWPRRPQVLFAVTAAPGISRYPDQLLHDGVVIITGLMSDILTKPCYGALSTMAKGFRQPLTIALHDGSNAEEEIQPFDPAGLTELFEEVAASIRKDMMAVLVASVGNAQLMALEGDDRHTMYFRSKTEYAFTPEHRDLGYFLATFPGDRLQTDRLFTVWVAIEAAEPSLEFQDGAGKWHAPSLKMGDAIVFNAAVLHKARPMVSGGFRASIDFRIKIL